MESNLNSSESSSSDNDDNPQICEEVKEKSDPSHDSVRLRTHFV